MSMRSLFPLEVYICKTRTFKYICYKYITSNTLRKPFDLMILYFLWEYISFYINTYKYLSGHE